MKLKIVSILLVLFLPLIIVINSAFAQEENPKISVLESDQTVTNDYFASGDRVEVLGDVDGDVFVAGGQIIIEGNVTGDVFAAGGSIEIAGNVAQNVYAAGGQINIGGQVGEDATVAGGNITFSERASITGDINIAGGNISVSSPVGQDVRVAGGNVTISNTVGQDVLAGVGALRLSRGAAIGDTLTYSSDSRASIASGATISGKTNYFVPQHNRNQAEKAAGALAAGAIAFTIASAISTLIVGIVLVNLFPRFIQNGVLAIKNNPWTTLLFGIIFLIITPILSILLLITLVGIPLSIILMTVYFLAIYASRIFAMVFIGEKVLGILNTKKAGTNWAFVAGLVTYYVLGIIPVIGFLVTLASVLLGLGAITKSLSSQTSKAAKK